MIDLEFTVEIQNDDITFEVEKVIGGISLPIYTGAYQVTPKAFEETILDTENKMMIDDVTVFEIPYDETSNLYGTTVVIAS